MSQTIETRGIDRLSISERIALVHEIWDSIASEAEHAPLSEAERQELDRRLAAHRANPDAAILWEQAESDTLARFTVAPSAG